MRPIKRVEDEDLVSITILDNQILVHRDPKLISQQELTKRVLFLTFAIFTCTICYFFFWNYPDWWPKLICFGLAFILICAAFQKPSLPNPFLIPINPYDIESIIISINDEGWVRIYIRNTKKKLQLLFPKSLQAELTDSELKQLAIKLGRILGKPVYIRHETILGWIERWLTGEERGIRYL